MLQRNTLIVGIIHDPNGMDGTPSAAGWRLYFTTWVDDKTIQAIMRHSSVAVTQQAYIKTLPKQSVDAMKRLEMLIGDTSSAILQ